MENSRKESSRRAGRRSAGGLSFSAKFQLLLIDEQSTFNCQHRRDTWKNQKDSAASGGKQEPFTTRYAPAFSFQKRTLQNTC